MKQFLSKKELAEIFGCSLASINRGLAAGTIPFVKFGGRVLIPSAVLSKIEALAVPGGSKVPGLAESGQAVG